MTARGMRDFMVSPGETEGAGEYDKEFRIIFREGISQRELARESGDRVGNGRFQGRFMGIDAHRATLQGGMNRKGAEVAKGRRKYMEETPVTWVASTLVSELRERF
jgi:hypothetical protein